MKVESVLPGMLVAGPQGLIHNGRVVRFMHLSDQTGWFRNVQIIMLVVKLLVSFHADFGKKCLPTRTRKSFSSLWVFVNSHVNREVLLLFERTTAFLALKGLFARMDAHVAFEIACLLERCSTFEALEGSLACMDPRMFA